MTIVHHLITYQAAYLVATAVCYMLMLAFLYQCLTGLSGVSRLTWTIILIALPFFGLLLWLFVGQKEIRFHITSNDT